MRIFGGRPTPGVDGVKSHSTAPSPTRRRRTPTSTDSSYPGHRRHRTVASRRERVDHSWISEQEEIRVRSYFRLHHFTASPAILRPLEWPSSANASLDTLPSITREGPRGLRAAQPIGGLGQGRLKSALARRAVKSMATQSNHWLHNEVNGYTVTDLTV